MKNVGRTYSPKNIYTIIIFTIVIIAAETLVDWAISNSGLGASYSAAIAIILTMPMFILLAAKVRKFGVIIIHSFVRVVFYMALLKFPLAIAVVAAGVIAEIFRLIKFKRISISIAISYTLFHIIFFLRFHLYKMWFPGETMKAIQVIGTVAGSLEYSDLTIIAGSILGYVLAMFLLGNNLKKAGLK